MDATDLADLEVYSELTTEVSSRLSTVEVFDTAMQLRGLVQSMKPSVPPVPHADGMLMYSHLSSSCHFLVWVNAGSWQCYRSNRPHRESCCAWWRIHCRAMSVTQDLTRVFATSQRRTPMPCKLATCCIGIKIAANIKFMTWRSLMNAVLLYCIARNLRQRKISSKRPSGSSSGIYFRQVPLRSFALPSCGRRSFAYRFSSNSWMHFLFNTCGYWKN